LELSRQDVKKTGNGGIGLLRFSQIKRSQLAAAPTPISVGAAAGCDLLLF
jgi:hypothetical protein